MTWDNFLLINLKYCAVKQYCLCWGMFHQARILCSHDIWWSLWRRSQALIFVQLTTCTLSTVGFRCLLHWFLYSVVYSIFKGKVLNKIRRWQFDTTTINGKVVADRVSCLETIFIYFIPLLTSFVWFKIFSISIMPTLIRTQDGNAFPFSNFFSQVDDDAKQSAITANDGINIFEEWDRTLQGGEVRCLGKLRTFAIS